MNRGICLIQRRTTVFRALKDYRYGPRQTFKGGRYGYHLAELCLEVDAPSEACVELDLQLCHLLASCAELVLQL